MNILIHQSSFIRVQNKPDLFNFSNSPVYSAPPCMLTGAVA